MPNINLYVQEDGKLYCWDDDTEGFVLAEFRSIDIDQIPKGILMTLVRKIRAEKNQPKKE